MSATPEPRVVGKSQLATGKWVSLQLLTYIDPEGKTRTWESAERTTRKGTGIDGVEILAIIKSRTAPDQFLLVKQFRPPLGRPTIEMPAGLIDESETVEETALRELKEECGYIGKVTFVTPILVNEPGMSNSNCKVVHVEIDGDSEENRNPTAHLDEGEFIERILVPVESLLRTLEELSKTAYIDAKLYTLAYGLHMTLRH